MQLPCVKSSCVDVHYLILYYVYEHIVMPLFKKKNACIHTCMHKYIHIRTYIHAFPYIRIYMHTYVHRIVSLSSPSNLNLNKKYKFLTVDLFVF